nr:DUF1848 family protein [uncultured Desulfobacter sp.]
MIDIEKIKNGKLIKGDSAIQLKRIPSESIGVVVTDPPYGLGYDKYTWDKKLPEGGIWHEALRVLKPGGFAFIMCSPRQDLLSLQIMILRKAGFFINFTSLYWIYKTGMSNARKIQAEQTNDDTQKNLENAYAGFQPRPATEVILVAMKPLSEKSYTAQAHSNGKGMTFLGDCMIPVIDKGGKVEMRQMSNVIVSDQALDPFGEECGEIECCDQKGNSYRFSLDSWAKDTLPYLLTAKASKKEKEFGLDDLPDNILEIRSPELKSHNVPMIPRPTARKNIHPMVKPLKLMSYLIVLGSRQGEFVLDPFCGSGTTCLAARLLGRKFIGIELEKKYYDIAFERLSNVKSVPQADTPNKHEDGSITKISEIESITLRFHDPSVIDLSTVKAAIDDALGNNPNAAQDLKNVEITKVLKSSEETSGATPSIYQQMISRTKKRRSRRGKPKIISASRRTDIPALYSDWFFNRIKEGVVLVKRKVDSPKIDKVFLEPEDVQCFVFWTKNPAPMLDRLGELDRYKYYFHFTLTPYGRDVEPNLPPKEELIRTFIRLSEKIGKKKVIWRYDPILLTDTIDLEYHKKNFEAMAKRLHQYTEKCIISFVKASKRAQDNMGLKKIEDDMKWELASSIQSIAEGYSLKVETCAQEIDFMEIGVTPAKCVDPLLIGDITGERMKNTKDTSQRKHCGCVPSIDIGTNDTCTHGCLYCYANKTAAEARLNYHLHKSDSPAMTVEMDINGKKEKDNVQDWADKGINISKGCSNNCRYCYAREESVRRHGNTVENWPNEQLNLQIINKGWRISNKRLMFPTTHDITPGTYDACETVLKKVLKVGNNVLVVSKPRTELIEKLCNAIEPYKNQVMFRFTITAMDNEVLRFWEPNAPTYEDRKKALALVKEKGFRNSVSIEPMLDAPNVGALIEDLRPHTTDCMWVGPMKMVRKRVVNDSPEVEKQIVKIISDQTPEKLLPIYTRYKDDPMIKWKGHYRKQLRKLGIKIPPQKDDWRDQL